MVDAAEVDARDATRLHEPPHRFDVAGEKNAVPRVGTKPRQFGNRLRDVEEIHIHLRRHTHPIELLLPLTGSNFIIDEDDEANIQRLSPADHDLSMNQAIVDAVKDERHADFTPPAAPTTVMAPRPRSAEWRAASTGGI